MLALALALSTISADTAAIRAAEVAGTLPTSPEIPASSIGF